MQRSSQISTSNTLASRNSLRSITCQLKLAEKTGDREALVSLVREHPSRAGRRYGKGNLGWIISIVNDWVAKNPPGQGLGPSDLEILHGLLARLAEPVLKGQWVMTLNRLGLEPLEKVARCPVCKRFFTRKRKDQKGCSHKCANLFRVRKWRERYYESYKEQRIRRQSEKGVK
jgi:hypothetical protein